MSITFPEKRPSERLESSRPLNIVFFAIHLQSFSKNSRNIISISWLSLEVDKPLASDVILITHVHLLSYHAMKWSVAELCNVLYYYVLRVIMSLKCTHHTEIMHANSKISGYQIQIHLALSNGNRLFPLLDIGLPRSATTLCPQPSSSIHYRLPV